MSKEKTYECFYCHSYKLQPGKTCHACGAKTLISRNKNNRQSRFKENYEDKYNNWRQYMDFLTADSLID